MSEEENLEILREQERKLQFTSFDAETAWTLGTRMRALAQEHAKPVALGIWLATHTLLYTGTNGINASNEDWLRRKRNTVLRFSKSSLLVGMELTNAGTTLEEKQGLSLSDFAAHGGGFPLLLRGTGCVGALVVSGLTQREDHALVVRALSEFLVVPVTQLG